MLRSVRRKIKSAFNNISNEKIKTNFLQAIPFWIASLITGIIAVIYARIFSLAERGSVYIFTNHSWLLFIITPACFLLAWWITIRFAPYARGSGIPQVMASIELATPKYINKVNKLLGVRIIITKIISSLVMIFGGGIIGREGPTIQIAGSVFHSVNQMLPAWWPKISKKNMIMTGAAAGLAAAFNTPLGGIVFAVEELTKTHISYFKTALFTAIIIAGLTAQALLGPYLYLGYPNVSGLSSHVFFWVVIVAIVAGLAGSLMSKLILALLRWKSSFQFKWQHVLYIVACAVGVAALAYFLDSVVLGSGKEVMTTALFTNDKYVVAHTPFLRIVGPVLSFTTGASGGIFAPSLGCGASIGSFMAGILQLSESNSNIIILSGMVAFLTGVTRSPFTSAILVLEMTDRHNVIFHLMTAGMISSLVSFLIDRHSFYDRLKVQYLHELHREADETLKERTNT
ncbi:MAG TPA: chloride channel protein [Chitinophagaceae bacterium]|nr:chloride channel protein [Chitinophagaceae bacterium]